MEHIVRRLAPRDWQVWRAVRLAALTDAPEAFYSTFDRERVYDAARWQEQLDRRHGVKVAAFAAGAPVGAAAGHLSDEVEAAAEVAGMWVAPAARGSGLGEELVHEVMRWAAEQDRTEMRLWVSDGNGRAERLYERLGFKLTDELWPHPRDPAARFRLMTRALPARRSPSPMNPGDPSRHIGD